MALQMRLSLRGVFSGRRVVWWELSVVPGDVLAGGGGCSERWAAPRFFRWFFVQSPGRSRIAARPVRGAAEACVSRALAASPLSFAIFALWHLGMALGCALPLDLDLNRLRQLRRRKEPVQLKRCRALSSAHDIHTLATEQCTQP